MREHVVDSANHGQLLVRTEQAEEGWRAVLVDPPARLAHVVATIGETEAAALERMAWVVDRYDGHGVTPRAGLP